MASRFVFSVAIVSVLTVGSAEAQPHEVIAGIVVHGNHTTPAAEILSLAGLSPGEAATDARLQEAARALRDSGRFAGVDLRKRYASIEDPTAILVVIVVEEHSAAGAGTRAPGPLARLLASGMWLPILTHADGYGFTYGARVSFVDALGEGGRLSVPATWGGERRLALEAERPIGALARVRGTVSVHRRINPHFETPDLRQEARVEVERPLVRWVRAGAAARLSRVTFGDDYGARHGAAGLHATFDTRADPSFPRNALFARVAWERLWLGANRFAALPEAGAGAGVTGRWTTELRGYAGIGGPAVLAVRALAVSTAASLPASERVLIGGSESLRGYRAGAFAGDNALALSAEVRLPLTSPLQVTRAGVTAFVDTAAAWPAGERVYDQRFGRGIGAGVYAGVAAVFGSVEVAWPRHGGPRMHFGLGVGF